MIEFISLNQENACQVCSYYKNSTYLISDYSIGLKTMWGSLLNPSFAVICGCLCVKTVSENGTAFDFPLPISEDADIRSALKELSRYTADNFIPFVLVNVPHSCIHYVTDMFGRYEISYNRKYSDYLYLTSKLAEMSGRSYSAQRNHIKKFKIRYQNVEFVEFNQDHIPGIKRFLQRFENVFAKTTKSAVTELALVDGMLSRVGSKCFRCGGFTLDGEIISFCFAEKCGDMLIDHIEKALYEFEGIYPATVQAFLQHFGSDVKYFNREDDSSDVGLKMSKLQYKPLEVVHKYRIHIKNELSTIETHPYITTERLIIDKILESDIKDYNTLCLDAERNKYWGYDFTNNCDDPDEYYFYLDQKKDFDNRLALTLAIRLGARLIGEGILYNFDCKGSCEVGIRILPEFASNGYGREALKALIKYGIYSLCLDSIQAKCCKENRASSNMLSAVMRSNGEDEKFEYYISTF